MADSETTHSSRTLLSYKLSTTISYLLFVITAFYYTFASGPERLWAHNPSTPFAQSKIVTSIYWLILFALQLVYAWSLYASNATYVSAAVNIGAHFVANNLLLFGFIHLWVRAHYWIALVLLVINFGNLSLAYFRHSTTPRAIHLGTVSGPLAWNFAALYWAGAVAVHSNHLAARIVANVFIWGWLGYGVFFLAAYKDYTIGFALSVLAFCKFVSAQFLVEVPGLTTRYSDWTRSIAHFAASSPTPVHLCVYDLGTLVRAFAGGRRAGIAWSRSVPQGTDCE